MLCKMKSGTNLFLAALWICLINFACFFLLTDLSFITTVYLICNKIDQLSIKEERNNSLKLNLQTICACPDGCHSAMNTFSPGTYIVIVFTSVMLSYLILGKSTLFLFIFCIRSVLVTLWMIVNSKHLGFQIIYWKYLRNFSFKN